MRVENYNELEALAQSANAQGKNLTFTYKDNKFVIKTAIVLGDVEFLAVDGEYEGWPVLSLMMIDNREKRRVAIPIEWTGAHPDYDKNIELNTIEFEFVDKV